MENPGSEDARATAQARLDEARMVYGQIFRALQVSLKKLEAGDDSPTEVRNRSDLFRSHLRQLQTVFELEGSLEKLGQGHFVTRLDLDAARDEIRERLARIRERQGGEGLS